MARKGTQMSLIGMIILLVVIVAVLPWGLRMLVRSVAGFEDASSQAGPAPSMNSGYVPDPNTNYICRSPNNSGTPCPEGEFCDGTTQACQRISAPATEQVVGYYQ
jgi:hypothetical protein